MNAAEQAESLELAYKIATVVNLFKSEFPDLWEDLNPWLNEPQTRRLTDPNSIDIGLHFPRINRSCQSLSILVQMRFHEAPLEKHRRLIGVEAMGYDYQGQKWRFSTGDDWLFEGMRKPRQKAQEKLKHICRQIYQLFDGSSRDT